MRIPAVGRLRGRLATLASVPIAAAILAACSEQVNHNPTGDSAAPNLLGETANGFGFPHEVVTTQGIESAGLYLPVFIIAVIVFVIIEGLLLFVTWRFRRRDGDTDLPAQTHGNNKLEFVWTAIPALIVTGMFIASTMVLSNVQATTDDPDVVMDVQAFRFGWTFDYDNGVQVAGGGREGAPEMVLPVDRSIRFRLHAADVIHSFYVPAFFFKRDVIPGRTNEFEITIEEPGVYGGQCAEFCGLAHGDMYFSVRAVEPDEYQTWVTEQGGTAPDWQTRDTELADAEEAVDEADVEAAEPDGDPGEPTRSGEPIDIDEVGAAGDVGEAEASPKASEEPGPRGSAEPASSAGATAGASVETDTAGEDGVVLRLSSPEEKPISFSTTEFEVKASQNVTVVYTNDSNVPHDVAFYAGADADAPELGVTEVVTGPGARAETSFVAPAEPGVYFFRCELHPLQMTGTLTVVP